MDSLCLGLIIAAGGLWASSTLRVKISYTHEQIFIGGTVWSQIVLPLGLLISNIVLEPIHIIVHGYFIVTGAILMLITSILVLAGECSSKRRRVMTMPNKRWIQRADIDNGAPSTSSSSSKRDRGVHFKPLVQYNLYNIGLATLILVTALLRFTELALILVFRDKA